MAYGQNMKAPMAGITGLAALKGRQGDNTLVHVNPMELKALDNMAPGGLTRNPYTGLPEAFKLKDILPALGATAAVVLSGGTALPAFMAAGLGGAAGAAAAGYNREEILQTGLLSGATAGMTGGFGNAASAGTQAGTDFAASELGKEAGKEVTANLASKGLTSLGQTGVQTAAQEGLKAGATEAVKQTAANAAANTLAQQAAGAGLGAAAPALMAAPVEEEEYQGPIQSIETKQTPTATREDIDKYIRQGGVTPQFFQSTITTPGIYRAEGGSVAPTSGEMFSGMVQGRGDGMSDGVPFEVVGDPDIGTAMLSPDEYVMDAHTVAALGNGSSDAGAAKLDEFRKALREKVYGKKSQPNQIDGTKELSKLA